MDNRTILVWFRNDLRIHDNEILLRAVERSNQIVPVYCFDPRHFDITKFGTKKTGIIRAAFIRENVLALKKALQQLGGDLIMEIGLPEEMIPKIAEKYSVDEVYHHREVADEETHVSNLVEESLWKLQINLRHFIGHTLYHKEDLPFPIKDIPDAFSVFKKKTERESAIRPQLKKPESIRIPEDMKTGKIPVLSDLGFTEEETEKACISSFAGGEHIALQKMQMLLKAPPSMVEHPHLSPYIAIGALSPNTLYHAIKTATAVLGKKRQEQYISKLLWRDYYRFMFKKHGNRFFHESGLTGNPPEKLAADELNFKKWKTGNTGHPIVDGGIRQLNETGYIPSPLRTLLAAYLIHELGVNWLRGAAWFEEKLIDYGPSNNYGNWAHIAGVGSSVKDNNPVDINKLINQHYPKGLAMQG